MNSQQFLKNGGFFLILFALLGFFGVLGPSSDASVFGSAWWFDITENWGHLIVGILALVFAYFGDAKIQQPAVIVVGVISILLGFYSIFTPSLLGANFQNPPDSIFHLIVGIWALISTRGGGE
ncbi:MAG: hypothetical protein NUV53_03210 [Patescibacteria group bacterium]|nr:hypothetical protein [Patescibacteria group bacterium]